MFKVGDIVRCKTDRYGITSYKRPCEIVGIPNKEYIEVRCLGGDYSIYKVDTDLFELVPLEEILQKGMYVKNSKGTLYKFINYMYNGITVERPGLWDDFLAYDDIVYVKKFKV